MEESGVYTEADLLPFSNRLRDLKQKIAVHTAKQAAADGTDDPNDDSPVKAAPPALAKLFARKVEICGTL